MPGVRFANILRLIRPPGTVVHPER